jgi:hypothetical protein
MEVVGVAGLGEARHLAGVVALFLEEAAPVGARLRVVQKALRRRPVKPICPRGCLRVLVPEHGQNLRVLHLRHLGVFKTSLSLNKMMRPYRSLPTEKVPRRVLVSVLKV